MRSSRPMTSPGQYLWITSSTRRRVSGPKPVGREVHQHADEVAVEVDAREHADRPALGAVDDELGQPQQVAGRRLEQLVAGQGAQRGQQLPAGVAVGAHTGAQQDLGDAPAHDRHPGHRAVLGVRDQAEEDVHHLLARRRWPASRR